jgi:peptidoglycan/xylan/chitin deacetylase (PgdA/CDA1 family)
MNVIQIERGDTPAAVPVLSRVAHSLRHVSPRLAGVLPGVVCRGTTRDAAGRPRLHITFDDGPDASGTPGILDLLARHGASATFFVLGTRAAADPGLLRAIAGAGHRIGNHGWGHIDAWQAPGAMANLARAESWLRDTLGHDVADVRPPYGHLTADMYRWARRGRRRLVLWDVMPGDYDPSLSAPRLSAVMSARVVPGSILVLHDGKPAARAQSALDLLLPKLVEAGWTFATL